MADPNAISLNEQVKALLREDLRLGPDARIDDDMPLIGGEFELDSLDVVLLVSSVEKRFGVKLPRDAAAAEVFSSVDAIVRFLESQNGHAAGSTASPAQPAADTPDLDTLLARLPHGEPFRFVSKLTDVAPGQRAEGVWEVRGDEAFFAGHFPGQPLVPGVLVSEALAQVSGLIAAAGAAPASARLAQVNVRFRQPIAPPAQIVLKSQLRQTVDTLQHCDVQALVGGEVVAEGEVTLKLSPQGA